MKKKTILILGAGSDIGLSISQRYSSSGYDIQLAGRDISKYKHIKKYRNLSLESHVSYYEFDVLNLNYHKNFIKKLNQLPDIVFCCVGIMKDQNQIKNNSELISLILRSNYEGPIHILSIFSSLFEKRGHGTIVGISSIAGDRGRAKNYFYGSAKSGFSTFLSGLRNQLYHKGVKVITVKPGFVYSKMTKKMTLNPMLTTTTDELAIKIFNGVKENKDIIYSSFTWKIISIVIKHIPEKIFKRIYL